MFVIAKNTIKEFIRNKILYVIIGLAVGLIFLSMILSRLALSEEQKIILDFSLSVIEIFGLITTLFLGTSLLYNEISKNTILLILSKNHSRKDFVLGKFIGFCAVIFMLYCILTLAFLVVLYLHNISIDPYYFVALGFSLLKIFVVLAFILFFSTFISPFITLFITIGIYFISHMTSFLKFYAIVAGKIEKGSFGEALINGIYYIFPNFHDLSIKDSLTSPFLANYSVTHISLSIITNLIYISFLLYFAILIFKRKEF